MWFYGRFPGRRERRAFHEAFHEAVNEIQKDLLEHARQLPGTPRHTDPRANRPTPAARRKSRLTVVPWWGDRTLHYEFA